MVPVPVQFATSQFCLSSLATALMQVQKTLITSLHTEYVHTVDGTVTGNYHVPRAVWLSREGSYPRTYINSMHVFTDEFV
jgi:hypothetical protein